jgi:SAM-dependent MidA family methyltransferase
LNPLLEITVREIQNTGVIPFARFMELALYCPVYGFYEKEKDKLGRGGDFFTSVSVGSLFGELLAFQFAEWLEVLLKADDRHRLASGARAAGVVTLVEAGAHDGRLARDILLWLRERRPKLFNEVEYMIIEPSFRRQEWQQQTLVEFKNKVRWSSRLNELNEAPVRGIIFSNELLDAMPVHRLGWNAGTKTWFEWGVALAGDKLVWTKVPDAGSKIPKPELPAALQDVLPDGFTFETCPAAVGWWRAAANVLQQGRLLTIDYGLTAENIFLPERKEGTLRAYHRQHLSADLLGNAGDQDLTAHVNFTDIQTAGETAGLKTEAFISQERFLTGIAEQAWKRRADFGEWTPARGRQFQTLTHPEHLGRPFRVLIQSRQGNGDSNS